MTEKDTSVIPHNRYYCYDHVAGERDKPEDVKNAYQLVPHMREFPVVGLCPYLAISSRGKRKHPNGHCKFLGVQDKDKKEDSIGYMLFDLLKLCRVNLEEQKE